MRKGRRRDSGAGALHYDGVIEQADDGDEVWDEIDGGEGVAAGVGSR